VFSNVIDLLFNCAAFIYIGAIIPFDMFNDTSIGVSGLYNTWHLLSYFSFTPGALLSSRSASCSSEDCRSFWLRTDSSRTSRHSGRLYSLGGSVGLTHITVSDQAIGPMGVGAIFIGTLAVSSLPAAGTVVDPHHAEQVERIRVVLIPIVSFLVLSSVITRRVSLVLLTLTSSDGMSIPFFSLGRRVHSITYTWSRNPSMDTRRDDEPAWTTHARRIQPGQKIVINRDEDPEEGDLGMRMGEKAVNSEQPSSPVEDESGGSSSSRTAAGREVMEKSESRQLDSDEERSLHEEREAADGEDVMRDEPQGGRSTPPLAQYREGNHLIIERRRGSGHEVGSEMSFHADSLGRGRGYPKQIRKGERDREADVRSPASPQGKGG